MTSRSAFIYFSPGAQRAPEILHTFAAERGLTLTLCGSAVDVVALVNRSFPACVVVDGGAGSDPTEVCRLLKGDAFSAIVPIVIMAPRGGKAVVLSALEAGADEVLSPGM
ncbi:MAG: hypothetical protein WD054_04260, partial [Gemmatimonadota bacterium]